MAPDPKAGKRITDTGALRNALVSGESCAACHRTPGSVHHVVQRGSPYFGDDVLGNLILLCGSGTTGCHGAWHGSPYEHEALQRYGRQWQKESERRDQEWVARRIGETIALRRRDVIHYVRGKLGDDAASEFFRRNYHLEVPLP